MHRHAIVDSSDYFESVLVDVNVNLLDLTHIDGQTLEVIIHFIYIGHIALTLQNIRNILYAASCLRIISLVKRCVQFLEEHLAVENCVEFLLLADKCKIDYGQLRGNAVSLVCVHFANILNRPELLRIQGNTLIEILQSGDLDVAEIDIFNFLVAWVRSDPNHRRFVPRLLDLLRLRKLPGEVRK